MTVFTAEHLTKRFGRQSAVDDVSLEIRAGEVLGLIGQNGSGKSTLLRLIAGLHKPDAGAMTLRGRPYGPRRTADAAALGVGLVHQEQSLLPHLTVAENIHLGRTGPATRGGVYRWGAIRRQAQRQLDKLACDVSPTALVSGLRFGERQMVELAKVLALEEVAETPLLILLDEPTSVLGVEEVAILRGEVQRLSRHSAVVFISHRMDEVIDFSDRVYVLSDGRLVAERPADALDEQELYRLMVGAERAHDYYLETSRTQRSPDVLLAVDSLAVRSAFTDVSFTIRRGSVVGIAGVAGSGREEVCRALCGAVDVAAGTIELGGVRLRPKNNHVAVSAGIGFVPAERKVEGMLTGRSVRDNFVSLSPNQLARLGLVRRSRENELVRQWSNRLHLRAPSLDGPIDTLSGGNQQKVVLGKWLLAGSLRLLILDHPTRGLDLGAKREVYEVLRELVAQGLSVLLISDTLEETLGLSDQLLVMRDGRVTAAYEDLVGQPPTREDIVMAMV